MGQETQTRLEDQKGDVTTACSEFQLEFEQATISLLLSLLPKGEVAEITVFPFICISASQPTSAVRGPGVSQGLGFSSPLSLSVIGLAFLMRSCKAPQL